MAARWELHRRRARAAQTAAQVSWELGDAPAPSHEIDGFNAWKAVLAGYRNWAGEVTSRKPKPTKKGPELRESRRERFDERQAIWSWKQRHAPLAAWANRHVEAASWLLVHPDLAGVAAEDPAGACDSWFAFRREVVGQGRHSGRLGPE